MNVRNRTLSPVILTGFFCALTLAAAIRPLSRTQLGPGTQLSQMHQGLERHTFLEVSNAGFHSQPIYELLIRSALPPIDLARQRNLDVISARQPDNWPVVFSVIHRRVPPTDSGGDSSPSA